MVTTLRKSSPTTNSSSLKTDLSTEIGVGLDLAAPEEYVPDIERNIRTVKERVSGVL